MYKLIVAVSQYNVINEIDFNDILYVKLMKLKLVWPIEQSNRSLMVLMVLIGDLLFNSKATYTVYE